MRRRLFFAGVALAVIVAAVFWPVLESRFVDFDDNLLVYENPHVLGGLSWEGLRWAFSSFSTGNWLPLSFLSHMLDVQLFGLNAGGHHLTSLLLHLTNSVLLLLLLRALTGAFWRSALVAALFAIHPLHVESVAWVSERKDVLSTLFGFLTMAAYLWYVRRPATGRFVLVGAVFTVGLLAKQMLVSLPFVLLLLDWWPLGRFRPARFPGKQVGGEAGRAGTARRLVLEKFPLLILSLVFSAVALAAQKAVGTVSSLEILPLRIRLVNAVVSYASYLVKTVWPDNLAFFYPHPGSGIPLWKFLVSLLFLGVVTILVIRWRREGYLVTGWFWYVGTLFPVIGVVQVGVQAMADRYTYLPLIGIFIMASWGAAISAHGDRQWRRWPGVVAGAAVSLCVVIAHRQVEYWKDSYTLSSHAVKVTSDNWMALRILGQAYADLGQLDESVRSFAASIRIMPWHATSRYNLGGILFKQGKINQAADEFRAALRLEPNLAAAHYNLGTCLTLEGKFDEAIASLREATRINPDHASAHFNLGVVLERKGQRHEAINEYREALRVRPDHASARERLTELLNSRMF
jgi:hypothetical protein